MGWRDKYKVNPAADVFPMMQGEELAKTQADIEANGVRVPVAFWAKYDGNGRFHGELIDGRNRLEAAERAGLDVDDIPRANLTCGDPVSWIISLNAHRRHITSKQALADYIVAAIEAGEKPVQGEPVSKGGRGKKSPIKEKALAAAKEHGISESTIKRAVAKADGKTPKQPAIESDAAATVESKRLGYDPFTASRGGNTDGDDEDAAIERKRWTSGVEAVWDTATDEVKQHLVRHIIKESDPVALAARLLTMMDADQLRRFCVMAQAAHRQEGVEAMTKRKTKRVGAEKVLHEARRNPSPTCHDPRQLDLIDAVYRRHGTGFRPSRPRDQAGARRHNNF